MKTPPDVGGAGTDNRQVRSKTFIACADHLSQAHSDPVIRLIDEFAALPLVPVADWTVAGIPSTAVLSDDPGAIRQARARFEFEPTLGRYFEFASDGLPSWCMAAREDGRMVDVIAWPIDKPRRHARLYRCAWALGADIALSPNRIGDDPEKYPPVYVFRDPVSWLRAGADGVVVLNATAAREELWHVADLQAEDRDHARELHAMMRPPAWAGDVFFPRRAA